MNFNKASFLAAGMLFSAISGAAEPTASFDRSLVATVQGDLAAGVEFFTAVASSQVKPSADFDVAEIAAVASSQVKSSADFTKFAAATDLGVPDKSDAESEKLLRGNVFLPGSRPIAAATDLGVPDKSDAESEKLLRGNGFLIHGFTAPIDATTWLAAWFSDASSTFDVIDSELGG